MGFLQGDAGLTKPTGLLEGCILRCPGEASPVPGALCLLGLAPALCTHNSLYSLSLVFAQQIFNECLLCIPHREEGPGRGGGCQGSVRQEKSQVRMGLAR